MFSIYYQKLKSTCYFNNIQLVDIPNKTFTLKYIRETTNRF